jgi:hypothetical protein
LEKKIVIIFYFILTNNVISVDIAINSVKVRAEDIVVLSLSLSLSLRCPFFPLESNKPWMMGTYYY